MMTASVRTLRLLGLLFIGMLLTSTWLVVQLFNGAFRPSVPVSLETSRVGLLTAEGSDVKMRNVVVGRVESIEAGATPGMAIMSLSLDPTTVHLIPENVMVRIDTSTIFGPKVVNLEVPPVPSETPIQAGAVIEASHVVTEINTLFEELTDVLRAIEPAKLNAALSSIASALDGRGDLLGELFVTLDNVLASLNESTPALQRDLVLSAEVVRVYDDVAPDFMALLRNFTITGGTLVDEREALDRTLEDLAVFAVAADDLLTASEMNLVRTLELLVPTTRLLAQYSPGIPCLLGGLASFNRELDDIFGGVVPGANMRAQVLPPNAPYSHPDDLPVIGADNPPWCLTLPFVNPDETPAPHRVFNDGSRIFNDGQSGYAPGSGGLLEDLFGDLLGASTGGGS